MSVGDGIAIGLTGLLIVLVVTISVVVHRSHHVRVTFEVERNGRNEGENDE